MKLRGSHIMLLVLLVFIYSYRLYMFQVSKDLAKSSKSLWNDYMRFSAGYSRVRYTKPTLRKDETHTATTSPRGLYSVRKITKASTARIPKRTKATGTALQRLKRKETLAKVVNANVVKASSVHNRIALPIPVVKQNSELCLSPGLQWIIYVHSAAPNVAKRNVIRQTWGNKNLFKDHRTAIIFLIGKTTEYGVQQRVDEEFKRYGDLVQGNFIDSYRNNTLKATLAFQYISAYCLRVPYAIKAEDDVVVDIFRVMDMVRTQKHRPFVMCYRWKNMQIFRANMKGPEAKRWGISEHLFPGKKYYPPYCDRLGYVITTKLLTQMYGTAGSAPYIHIDDIYTGLLMNKLSNVTFIDVFKQFSYDSWTGRKEYFARDRKPYFVFTVYPYDSRVLWRKVLRHLDKKTRSLIHPVLGGVNNQD